MTIPRSPFSVRNEVVLLRDLHKGALLLVEGGKDAAFLRKFIDKSQCWLVIAYSKHGATEATKLLEEKGFAGVLAIVDADFDLLERKANYGNNIVLTDCHDIEAMTIRSKALDGFINQFSDPAKFGKFFKGVQRSPYGDLVKERLLAICRNLGYFRWYSLRNNLTFRFRDLNLAKYVDPSFSTMLFEELVSDLTKDLNPLKPGCSDIHDGIKDLISKDHHDIWMICCGHDLTKALLVGLRRFGNADDIGDWDLDRLEDKLRSRFGWSDLIETQLFRSLKQWEERNRGYRVFKL